MGCIESFRSQDAATRKRITILLSVLLFVTLLTITLLAVLIPRAKSVGPGGTDRIECPGFETAKQCIASGCTYENVRRGPACIMKKDSFGYKVVETSPDGKRVTLESRTDKTPYGPSLSKVVFETSYINENIVRVKLFDAQKERYEVPVQKEFPLLQNRRTVNTQKLAYEVLVTNKDVFGFQVKRKDGTVLWDTSIGGLVMSDQFLQVASYLPSSNVYGLGEHTQDTLRLDLEYKSWPMFARDRGPVGGQINLYGVHPFYTCLENTTKSHGVLFLNSNAMEITLLPDPAISFRTIGGILDFFYFVGDNPEHVVQLYTSLIGRPMMPPYWGLGFQLSRYGYNNLDNVKEAVERTRKAKIAQDVQFLDIDHMYKNRDFTYDNDSFAGLIDYIKKTKEEYDLKWIIIIDPAIEAAKGYAPYETGMENKVFVKRHSSWKPDIFPPEVQKEEFVYGKVWPDGVVAFPDFLNQNAQDWWIKTITDYHLVLPFDGLWIDMNEPSNFGTNEKRPFYCPSKRDCWSLKCPESPYDDPPYNPLKKSGSSRLSTMTLCMDSVQNDGTKNYSHYDVHSLYGWSETLPTLKAAEIATKSRSLVISRSTYVSSGRYSGHWLGDNKSTWEDMRRSIVGMLEFNLFGIPYIGADVCGFSDDTTNELCIRWMQLGAFYPFFRNHNGIEQRGQDPASLGPDVVKAAKSAVERRYTLQPYLYTLFYRAHVDGSTVNRPVFHEFPDNNLTWNMAEQFMWGNCVMVSPILHEGNKTVRMYLPENEEWWHFNYNFSKKEQKLGYIEKEELEGNIPMHVRGGCMIPIYSYFLNGENTEKEMDLIVFIKNNASSGELFIDDGVSKDTIETKNYALFKFTVKDCIFEMTADGIGTYSGEYPELLNFHFLTEEYNDGSGDPYPSSRHVFVKRKLNELLDKKYTACGKG